MHAVVFTVEFKPSATPQQLDNELDHLASHVRTIPGFVRGTWATDGRTGVSFQLFTDETAARSVAANASVPADAAVSLRSANVYEVARDV
ncbi:hypothetical protein [Amycolatopsis echigonensis]|uniref:ABM domain-containing protein n=1 Tax=Amycolatopsis echigonensis TaxID=2576905 RepID=A0A2N3WUZ7_9PSEU|nr:MULTISPECIES: hypothetical protein [Amycolatopsis]MBB2497653.1 hypothetical protein [Amycolatopsis echigonensis]PKV97674.1 hypothetical protein ATK30_8667 [Amycolatopsis niigatensis]